jgi:hypothetical protein
MALLRAAPEGGPMMLRSEFELELQPKASSAKLSNPKNFRISDSSVEQVVGFHSDPLIGLPWPPANSLAKPLP